MLADEGVEFVGPNAHAINGMGDKIMAEILLIDLMIASLAPKFVNGFDRKGL